MEYVLDIETNGLNPDVIHTCFVGDEEFRSAEEFKNFTDSLTSEDTIYAHNGIAFDFPILRRLWNAAFGLVPLRDTLVLSRLAVPSRPDGHSLRAWGNRLGFPKDDYDGGWDTYSREMAEYCKRDVAVTQRVLETVREELAGFSEECIRLEHVVARIIAKQVDHGWLLDEVGCFRLLQKLRTRQEEVREEVQKTFKPYPKAVREVVPKVTKAGTLSKVGLNAFDDHTVVGGAFTHVQWPEFNLGSRKQIGEYLVRFGWKPTKFTETGQPIVDEGTLEGIKGVPEAQLIAEFLMLQKRVAQVDSWLNAVKEDGRVHGRVNSNGANTGRMTHMSPNVAQVPASRAPYGTECRAVWTVPDGYVLVGCDAEGLELRCLAHYMNDDAFTEAVVNGDKDKGTDVHTMNMKAAGLSDRDQAKTFIYAFLYGAGDAKIGEIVGGSRNDGRKLKERFLARTPALRSLRQRVEQASQRGWLKSLDGRRLHVRSQHSALNTLLQGAGAVIMKQALCILDRLADEEPLEFHFVGNIHDEFQAEVLADEAERFAVLAEHSIFQAGVELGLRCPLAGSSAIGLNWAETH